MFNSMLIQEVAAGACAGAVSSTHAHCLPRGFQGELSAVVLRSFFYKPFFELRVVSEPSKNSSSRTASEERDQDGDEVSRARPSSESPSMAAILSLVRAAVREECVLQVPGASGSLRPPRSSSEISPGAVAVGSGEFRSATFVRCQIVTVNWHLVKAALE